MFNIGAGELFAIFVIALIFWGPGALPEIGRSLGRFVKSMRGFARQIRDELGPAAQELDELRSTVDEIRNPVAAFAREVADAPSRFDAMMRRKNESAQRGGLNRPADSLDKSVPAGSIPVAAEDDYLSMLVERDYGRAGDANGSSDGDSTQGGAR